MIQLSCDMIPISHVTDPTAYSLRPHVQIVLRYDSEESSLCQFSCGISGRIETGSNLLPSTSAVAHLTLFSSTPEGVACNFDC